MFYSFFFKQFSVEGSGTIDLSRRPKCFVTAATSKSWAKILCQEGTFPAIWKSWEILKATFLPIKMKRNLVGKILGKMCVCVFSSHSFWTSSPLDVPAGVTQEEGHTGFLIHLPSAVRALIFFAKRIQPFLSLVDPEVEFLCANDLIVLYSLGILFLFYFLVRKIPFTGIELTSQRVRRLRGYL